VEEVIAEERNDDWLRASCEWCGTVLHEDGRGLCKNCGGARSESSKQAMRRKAFVWGACAGLIPIMMWKHW
jgi:hypothetical protein